MECVPATLLVLLCLANTSEKNLNKMSLLDAFVFCFFFFA